MWRWLVAMLLLCTGVASTTAEGGTRVPPKNQIQLLLTQSERAFDTYEHVLEQETQAGSDIAKTVPKDREVLKAAHDLIARLKKVSRRFQRTSRICFGWQSR
jgi:hypothetical protein